MKIRNQSLRACSRKTKPTATFTAPASLKTSPKISAPAWKHAEAGCKRKACASEAFSTRRDKFYPCNIDKPETARRRFLVYIGNYNFT
jgi:hypothetical protein